VNKTVKFVLILAASLLIGLFAYALFEQYLAFKQVERKTVNMTENLLEAVALEINPLHAISTDTGEQHNSRSLRGPESGFGSPNSCARYSSLIT
jgi:hypothetical protein